jgi:hypothetical protein
MRESATFQLEVLPRGGESYGLSLSQKAVKREGPSGANRILVRIWGTPLEAALDRVLEALKGCGFRSGDLRRGRTVPFELPEESGVRLGLLFLAVKPLRRLDRIAAISETVRDMEAEEAYYWFSKCSRPDLSRRACRSLRILLAKE